MTTHVCGAGMAFLGFSLSLIIGLWVNNSFITVVQRGLVVLVLFYVLGCLLAGLGQKAVQENFDAQVDALDQEPEADTTREARAGESMEDSRQDGPQDD